VPDVPVCHQVAQDLTLILGEDFIKFFQKFHCTKTRIVCADLNAFVWVIEAQFQRPDRMWNVPTVWRPALLGRGGDPSALSCERMFLNQRPHMVAQAGFDEAERLRPGQAPVE